MSRKMADRVSIVAVSIAAFLTTINQICGKKDLYMDDNSYNHSDSNEMDGISVVLMGVSYPGIIGMTRIEGDNLQEKRSRKEQRMDRQQDFWEPIVIILITHSFLAFHSVTGQMNGWKLRTGRKASQKSSGVRNTPCMRQSRDSDRWKQQ